MGETIAISVDPARYDAIVTGSLVATLGGEQVTLELTIPAEPVATDAVLPVLHELSSHVMARSAAMVEANGRHVSCRAGCAACCRQLVPLPDAEARHIAALVEAMPEPRRATIRARFDAAIDRIEATGLLRAFDDPCGRHEERVGMDYFRLGIACPFLEDERCSIHADRPLSCREYLVTSPAEHCADPRADVIDPVPVGAKLMRALIRAEHDRGWTPLTLALRHVARHPPPPPRDGPAILAAVMGALPQSAG